MITYRSGVKVPSRNALARRSSNDQYSDYSYSSNNSQLGNYQEQMMFEANDVQSYQAKAGVMKTNVVSVKLDSAGEV